MRAGALRHFITIETVTETADSMGGLTEVWSEFTTAYASINQMKGDEVLEHMKLGSDATHKIWIRYQAGITAKMRIKFRDRTFKIIGRPRNREERDRTLEIIASEDSV